MLKFSATSMGQVSLKIQDQGRQDNENVLRFNFEIRAGKLPKKNQNEIIPETVKKEPTPTKIASITDPESGRPTKCRRVTPPTAPDGLLSSQAFNHGASIQKLHKEDAGRLIDSNAKKIKDELEGIPMTLSSGSLIHDLGDIPDVPLKVRIVVFFRKV